MSAPILVVTSVDALGRPVREPKGLVVGHAVVQVDVFEEDDEDEETPPGGKRVGTYERALSRARTAALAELLADARRVGANAVVDTRLQLGEVSESSEAAVFASFTGTALVI
ncbi:MAG: heavy metal-binding domain-containing protein [Planctomycetes bacterium]|nr:heavy metal-binding domain-containing protein [Planctomycetota bacterium]